MAKSTSVNPRLVDLAEETSAALTEMSSSDEFSSLSGYESIGNDDDFQGDKCDPNIMSAAEYSCNCALARLPALIRRFYP